MKVNKENDREEEEWLCVGETTYVTEEDFQTQLEYQMDAPCRSIFLILIYLNVVTHNFQLLEYMWMYLQISFFFPK